jgi:hypothetical protein
MTRKGSSPAGALGKKGAKTRAIDDIDAFIERNEQASWPAGGSLGSAEKHYKSLTVKLDRTRYVRLKWAGLKQNKSSQAIFVQALDEYLAKARV